MANSVSKINIVVGASTGQLTAGMNKAAASVKGGMSQVQAAAQQATYAVDDFFTAFSTGGVAGGLRGAGNNLTMLAASLGGIKTQLAVIAGLATAQLLISYFKGGATEAEKLNDQLEQMNRHFKTMSSLRSIRRDTLGLREEAKNFREQPAPTRAEVAGERQRITNQIESSKAESKAKEAQAAELRAQAIKEARRAIAEGGGQVKDQEVAKRIKGQLADAEQLQLESQQLTNQAKDQGRQLELLTEREKQLQGKWFRDEQAAGDAGFKGFGAFITNADREVTKQALEDVTDELNARRARYSMADMFRMMPNLNTMGSVGAISAINSAMIGPQNARDSGVALQRQSVQELRRIRELEERKKGLLEVVGL